MWCWAPSVPASLQKCHTSAGFLIQRAAGEAALQPLSCSQPCVPHVLAPPGQCRGCSFFFSAASSWTLAPFLHWETESKYCLWDADPPKTFSHCLCRHRVASSQCVVPETPRNAWEVCMEPALGTGNLSRFGRTQAPVRPKPREGL